MAEFWHLSGISTNSSRFSKMTVRSLVGIMNCPQLGRECLEALRALRDELPLSAVATASISAALAISVETTLGFFTSKLDSRSRISSIVTRQASSESALFFHQWRTGSNSSSRIGLVLLYAFSGDHAEPMAAMNHRWSAARAVFWNPTGRTRILTFRWVVRPGLEPLFEHCCARPRPGWGKQPGHTSFNGLVPLRRPHVRRRRTPAEMTQSAVRAVVGPWPAWAREPLD